MSSKVASTAAKRVTIPATAWNKFTELNYRRINLPHDCRLRELAKRFRALTDTQRAQLQKDAASTRYDVSVGTKRRVISLNASTLFRRKMYHSSAMKGLSFVERHRKICELYKKLTAAEKQKLASEAATTEVTARPIRKPRTTSAYQRFTAEEARKLTKQGLPADLKVIAATWNKLSARAERSK